MHRIWPPRFWRPALICLVGAAGLWLLSLVCFRVQASLATAGFSLLILVTLVSLVSTFPVSVVLSLAAVTCLNYFFVPPLFSLRMEKAVDIVALLAFLTSSLVITGLSARVRRLAEEKLEQTRADLARLARVASLGELTASISHEVNQPLAGVVSSGNACQRWLASEPPNLERARQSLDRIIRDANRASEVVERVRNLAKNSPPKKTPLNINDAVMEVIALTRGQIEHRNISLTLQLADDISPAWADRVQLQQVLLNLIINAIEAIEERAEGPRKLLVSASQGEAGELLVAVRDTGKGLAPEAAPRLFDAFYTTKREGMGMGLAVCRGIIQAHGGRLWATPNQPRGAVFQFTLPLRREEAV